MFDKVGMGLAGLHDFKLTARAARVAVPNTLSDASLADANSALRTL